MTIEKQSNGIKGIKGIKGGKRQGAGRKKGVPNKRTAAIQAAVEASGESPLQYLLARMRDMKADPRDRMTAAISAAPYVHAKLSSVDLKANIATHEASLDELA